MAGLTVNPKNPNEQVDMVARVEGSSSRTIQVLSPINGKKKIVDFGLNIKTLNLTVYTSNIENFSAGGYVNVFSSEFQGQTEIQTVTQSSYSSLPYQIANITAIGEDTGEGFNTSGNIYSISGLEDYYSVTYQTTHIENIGTGFNIAISSKTKDVDSMVTFKYADQTYTLGDSNARLIGTGSSISRTMASYTTSYGDPLSIILQKTVIISTITKDENEFLQAIGGDTGKVTFFTADDIIQLTTNTIGKGDIAAFINQIIGGDISIDGSKQDKSPIVKMLQSSGSMGQGYFTNVFYSSIREQWINTGILSVGQLLAQLLPVFGLEIYYNQGGAYTLEPPRFVFFDGDTKSSITVDYSDIESIVSEEPKINIPSLIIPQIDFTNMALKNIASKCSEILAAKIVSALSNIEELPVFKIETYSIPNLLLPEYLQANKDALFDRINDNFAKIWKYYSGFAFKSIFQRMNTGTINLTFRPDIVEPYKWYNIGDEWYFVTTINHTLQRGSVSTILQYAGRYDEKLFTILDQILSSGENGGLDCGKIFKKQMDSKNLHTPMNKKDPPSEKTPDIKEKVDPETIKKDNS